MTSQPHLLKRLLMRWGMLYRSARMAKIMRRVPLGDWKDLRRLKAIFRVLPNTMVSGPRLINAYECTRIVEQAGIRGAIVECGVCSGGCIGLMALASRRYGDGRRTLHLFDSFQGLHQPSRHDSDVVEEFRAAHPGVEPDDGRDPAHLVPINVCVGSSADEVRSFIVDRLRVDPDRVVIHEGWFQQTVPAAGRSIDPIAVLRLDGDLYESTRISLEHLYDRVVEGGFIIIDDYGTFAGCRKAVREFLTTRGIAGELMNIDDDGVFLRKPAAPPPGSAGPDETDPTASSAARPQREVPAPVGAGSRGAACTAEVVS